jgi:hypothetical protein
MNNDLFDCSPLKINPNFQQDYREQHQRFHSSFGNELILDRAARAASDGASYWVPQEQQDCSSAGASEEPLEYYIPQVGNHAQPWRVPCRITPPPPPPNCNEQQQQHEVMHARNHHSNQHHQQAGYFISLKNDNYATTHEKRITDSGRVVDSSNGALFQTKNKCTRTETTTSFPVNDTSIQQEELPVSSPHVVHAQGESTSLLGASPFKMTVLFAAASSVGNKNQDKNATTQGENKASTTTEETRQDKAHPSRRRRKSKKTPKPTVQERNALSRARSAELRNRIAFIRNIPENVRTFQEKQELEQEEARKLKKSLQSKQRLALENANLARIQALAPEQWTNDDKDFMDKINARKQRKSQTDRQRRERLKLAKEKAQLAGLRQLMSI